MTAPRFERILLTEEEHLRLTRMREADTPGIKRIHETLLSRTHVKTSPYIPTAYPNTAPRLVLLPMIAEHLRNFGMRARGILKPSGPGKGIKFWADIPERKDTGQKEPETTRNSSPPSSFLR